MIENPRKLDQLLSLPLKLKKPHMCFVSLFLFEFRGYYPIQLSVNSSSADLCLDTNTDTTIYHKFV